jgi:hypothetical protein
MYHLLIEWISTVTSEFLQYRARVQIGLNRTSIERIVERTNLFASLNKINQNNVGQNMRFILCGWFLIGSLFKKEE